MARTRAPRPGFVLDVDRSTPPIVFPHGAGFRAERLPAGSTRVVYAPDPRHGIDDREAAVRRALREPVGCEPLTAQLRPGMKLTIAFDDVSQPRPAMRAPDVRQQIIEAVLDLAAEAGVDDVQLVAARGLRRRMTEPELRHAVGDRVYDAFAPHGLLANHDGADPDGLVVVGSTDGAPLSIAKRAAESDLVVDVRIEFTATRAGHEPLALRLSGYRPPRDDGADLDAVLRDAGIAVFQISATLNSDAYGIDGPLGMLQKREPDWSPRDRASFVALQAGLRVATGSVRRRAFERWKAPYGVTSVQAGEPAAVRELANRHLLEQRRVPVTGQTDILTIGLPDIGPSSVDSVMNPVLVAALGLSWATDHHCGAPLVREGGVLILSHPTPWHFHPVHHPSYIDFFEQVLSETTDPAEIEQRFEKRFAEDEWYQHLYRTSYAFHGVHPLHTWYETSSALAHFGRVIVVGGDPDAVRRLGLRPASTLGDALEMASDVVGRHPSITHLHDPLATAADVS